MAEGYLQWYCGLSQSKAEEDCEGLKKEGIRAMVEPHGSGFCVCVDQNDLPKVIELEAKKHNI